MIHSTSDSVLRRATTLLIFVLAVGFTQVSFAKGQDLEQADELAQRYIVVLDGHGPSPAAFAHSHVLFVQEDAPVQAYQQVLPTGIDWVTANADTIEVVNMSLGGTGSDDGACGANNGDACDLQLRGRRRDLRRGRRQRGR